MSKNLAKDISVLLHRAESDPFVQELADRIGLDMDSLKLAGKVAVPAVTGLASALIASLSAPRGKKGKRALLWGTTGAMAGVGAQQSYKHLTPLLAARRESAKKEAEIQAALDSLPPELGKGPDGRSPEEQHKEYLRAEELGRRFRWPRWF